MPDGSTPGGGAVIRNAWSIPDWFVALVLGLVSIAGLIGSVRGDWVYDDKRQIVQNRLIQDDRLVFRALTSDVWAFKSAGMGSASNYWRPTFTAWCIVNHRVFGLRPAGWHASNLCLHAVATGLGFMFLRRLGVHAAIGVTAMLLWAVHPTKVESVAWISGAPDTLLAVSLFGSALALIEWLRNTGTRERWLWISLGLYALALGSKEVAILWPAVVTALVFEAPSGVFGNTVGPRDGWRAEIARAVRVALPFAAAGLVYFVVRWMILGAVFLPQPGAAPRLHTLTSLPHVVSWYGGRVVWPSPISMHYGTRSVGPGEIGLQTFWAPLAILIAVGGVLAWAAWPRRGDGERGSWLVRIGVAIGVCTLAPALNSAAFPVDHLVHDRYLYVPLLGAILVLVGMSQRWSDARGGSHAATRVAAVGFGLLAGTWLPSTLAYTRAFETDAELWRFSAAEAPGAASNHVLLAVALQQERDIAGAWDAINAAVKADPTNVNARLVRAELMMERGALGDAEREIGEAGRLLNSGFGTSFDHWLMIDRHANILFRAGRFGDAAAMVSKARERLPMYFASLTDVLAVLMVRMGDKQGALRELEAASTRVDEDLLSGSRLVLYRMGMLQIELGLLEPARASLQRFLQSTEGLSASGLADARVDAAAALARIRK